MPFTQPIASDPVLPPVRKRCSFLATFYTGYHPCPSYYAAQSELHRINQSQVPMLAAIENSLPALALPFSIIILT